MRIGTTPTFEFELPSDFDASTIANAKITFTFNGVVKLEKYLCDCSREGQILKFKLTQEETFLFENDTVIEIQVRIVTTNGEAFTTDVLRTVAQRCLDDEVLE